MLYDMIAMVKLNPQRRQYSLALLVNLFRIALDTCISSIALKMIGDSIVSGDAHVLWLGILWYVPVTIASVLIHYAMRRFLETMLVQFRCHLREQLTMTVLQGSHTEDDTDALYARLTQDTDAVANFCKSLYYAAAGLVGFAVSVGVGIMMSWQICTFLLGLGLLKIALHRWLVERMEKAAQGRIQAGAKMLSAILEAFRGCRSFRFLNRSAGVRYFEKEYSAYKEQYREESRDHVKVEMLDVLMNFSAVATLIVVGSLMILFGAGTLGTLMSFLSLQDTLANPLTFIGDFLREVKVQSISYKRYASVTGQARALSAAEPCEALDELHIDKLDFAYGDRSILRDLTLTIPAGTIQYVVGASGCGKTTLAKLMLGILQAQHGQVDYRCKKRSVTPRMAYVAQTPLLMQDTVERNICLSERIDRDRLQWAMTSAGLSDFLQVRADPRTMIIDPRTLSLGQSCFDI